ncbi:MAG: hypothetical protein HY428_02295 [Candidatus Levybacteria bacterium]|nr:hypothetical protein [Candidatus Levybacteria bacterium]
MSIEKSVRNQAFALERRVAAGVFRKERAKTMREQAEQQRTDEFIRDYPDLDIAALPPVPRLIPGEVRPKPPRGHILARSFGRLSIMPISRVFETVDEKVQRLAVEEEARLKRRQEADEFIDDLYYKVDPKDDIV